MSNEYIEKDVLIRELTEWAKTQAPIKCDKRKSYMHKGILETIAYIRAIANEDQEVEKTA